MDLEKLFTHYPNSQTSIGRVHFFTSLGALPLGMKNELPRDWQYQCIPRNDRAII